eukprot:GILJ01036011.1.p1 GENE.GILJ01036011.1~~GILJ01036011.1.p1  ORF type:complete len:183 (-),score=11.87 GILJ01036011.1:70-558(-)
MAKADGEPEPLNVLLLCVGRVSGDVSGLVAIVDGMSLSQLAVSKMRQASSAEYSDEWSILQRSVEAAAVIGDAATAGRSQGWKKPLGIHVALVNVFNEGHLKSSSTPGCPFRICLAPNHVNELDPSYLIHVHHQFVGLPSAKSPWDNVPSMASEWLSGLFEY